MHRSQKETTMRGTEAEHRRMEALLDKVHELEVENEDLERRVAGAKKWIAAAQLLLLWDAYKLR